MSQRCSCDLCCPGTVSQFHGEDADWQAVLADEREMGRDMQYKYDHLGVGGPHRLLAQAKKVREADSDRPRRNVPWRRG